MSMRSSRYELVNDSESERSLRSKTKAMYESSHDLTGRVRLSLPVCQFSTCWFDDVVIHSQLEYLLLHLVCQMSESEMRCSGSRVSEYWVNKHSMFDVRLSADVRLRAFVLFIKPGAFETTLPDQ